MQDLGQGGGNHPQRGTQHPRRGQPAPDTPLVLRLPEGRVRGDLELSGGPHLVGRRAHLIILYVHYCTPLKNCSLAVHWCLPAIIICTGLIVLSKNNYQSKGRTAFKHSHQCSYCSLFGLLGSRATYNQFWQNYFERFSTRKTDYFVVGLKGRRK